MPGSVYETYVAALQHDTADVPEDATRIGVVRRPTPWFYGAVDENVPELAPSEDLLDETKARQEELESEDVPDAEAHNRAMEEVDFADRYVEHIESDPDARDALADLESRLRDGESIVLVCYENTDEKRCHRTELRKRLRHRLD